MLTNKWQDDKKKSWERAGGALPPDVRPLLYTSKQANAYLSPNGLLCTNVHITDFSLFWREGLMCTFVHNSMHIQHTEQRIYHAIYGVLTEPSGFAVAHGWYLSGVYTGLSKIEVVWQCYQSANFVSVFVWRNSVGGDSQFWWGIEFSAN